MAYFRDADGNVKGWTVTMNEITYLHDAHGNIVASYDARINMTRSASGSEVLRENQLLTFLK